MPGQERIMAKPAQNRAKRSLAAQGSERRSGRAGSNRERIVEAFMQLLAEKPFERIGLAEIAESAGVTLAQLRDEFASTGAILAAHAKAIDHVVLEGGEEDMAEEPARERLFDVLMRRLEALKPYREAIRSLLMSALRNPPLALALNGLSLRSQQWMLTAAGIESAGPKGLLRAQALSLLFARVLWVFVDDEDPGLARTMAALDRELARAERWSGFLDDLCLIPEALLRRRHRRRPFFRRRHEEEGGEETLSA
jgi:AcrR family transcriptional regulator